VPRATGLTRAEHPRFGTQDKPQKGVNHAAGKTTPGGDKKTTFKREREKHRGNHNTRDGTRTGQQDSTPFIGAQTLATRKY